MPLPRTRVLPLKGMTLQQRIRQETGELKSRLATAHRSLDRQSKYVAELLEKISRLEAGILARDLLIQQLKRQAEQQRLG